MTRKLTVSLIFVMSCAGLAEAAQVWQSTFDVNADGVVDVRDRDSTKVMIGPVSGGRLQITTKDKLAAFNSNDRAGRPLGATLNGNSSFGALYKFNWSTLHEGTTPSWQGFGFIGGDNNIARQIVGGLLQHRKSAEGTYFVRLGVQYGESGTGSHFYRGGAEVNLGASPQATDFYLAIGYDGGGHILSIAMYDAAGLVLGQLSADLDDSSTGLIPSGVNSVQTMLDASALTHLGWNDYVASGQNSIIVWQVDSLTYYNNATDAFNMVPSQSVGACCAPNDTCVDNLSNEACLAVEGFFNGATTSCGTVICPDPVGACCNPDGSCDESTEADCLAASGTWQGANTACTLTDCPQPPTGACCKSADGSCVDGLTEFTCEGTFQGADTVCANVNCPPPLNGACCLPNGACIEVTAFQCDAQCGTFNGAATTCAAASCPQDPVGACCMPDGTCTEVVEYLCPGAWHGESTTCGATDCRPMPTLVWWENFHTDLGGVVDLRDNNPTKELFEGQCDGRLQVHTQSRPNNWEVNDRGGKPLGTTVNGNDDFSALYRFRWSDLPESEDPMWEFISFHGDRNNPTQQAFGVMLQHNKVGTDYYVRMCSAAGELQYYFLFQCGTTYNLGPDAETNEYQLVVSYEGDEHLLTHSIFNADGTLLGESPTQSFQTWDLDIVGPNGPSQNYFDITPPQTTKQDKYDATALTHVGWLEYTQPTTLNAIWQTDSLAYFSSAGGAYNAVYGPTPLGSCCLPDGTCADDQTEQACLAESGGWSADGTCETVECIGACCLPDATCVDGQTAPDCDALGGSYAGLGTACAQTECPLPPCSDPFADADFDGDVDQADFAVFQRCHSGAFPYENPGTCHCFDRDADNDIDGDDYLEFAGCSSGPMVMADPACDDAP